MHRQEPTPARSRRLQWFLSVALYGLLPLVGGCAQDSGLTLGRVVIQSDAAPVSGDDAAVEAYYSTVFLRMRDALRSGNREGLEELRYMIAQHKRDDMVDFAWQKMAQFELLAKGLGLQLDLQEMCRIELLTAVPRTHTPAAFRLVCEPSDGRVLELGGSGTPVVFRVLALVRDFDATGQFVQMEDTITLPVKGERRLEQGGEPLRLPFALPGARPLAVIRELMIRVELLPCVVRVDGEAVPVGQGTRSRLSADEVRRLSPTQRLKRGASGFTGCCSFDTMMFPAGYEPIEKEPLKTLRRALRRGDRFKHTFLAAWFMPEKDKEAAMTLLVGHVRTGTPSQAQVAMGALRMLSKQDLPVTERREWLIWWKRHREQRGKSTENK